MGKRKGRKRKPPPRKIKLTVPTQFDCPFCNHEDAVECKMDKKDGIGTVMCNVCKVNYSVNTNALSEPIDVYSAWIDHCHSTNKRGAGHSGNIGGPTQDEYSQDDEPNDQVEQQEDYYTSNVSGEGTSAPPEEGAGSAAEGEYTTTESHETENYDEAEGEPIEPTSKRNRAGH
ncbi:transcription elongation factor 1 [Pelomyxa schiedti]|nr:transcription elongation factor 1 [Pelomyxa schiedti]